jgi:uncharacterized SAM-binding protein YcdF (DUF218 family)
VPAQTRTTAGRRDLHEGVKTGIAAAEKPVKVQLRLPLVSRQKFTSRRAVAVRLRVRRLAWSLAVLAVLLGAAWLFRAPLLTGLAKAWIVDEPLNNADAIVILGGHPELRAVEAARLYHQGLAPRILYMDVKLSPISEMGIIPSEQEVTRRLLLTNGVPESALSAIGQSVSNTYEESRAVRDWMEQTGLHSIIIPTDLAHTRRVRWIFHRELGGMQAQVRIHAVHTKEFGVNDWWRHEDGIIAFQNEFLKSAYYHLKY